MSTTDMFHNDVQCYQAYVAKMDPSRCIYEKCMQHTHRITSAKQSRNKAHNDYNNSGHINMCKLFWFVLIVVAVVVVIVDVVAGRVEIKLFPYSNFFHSFARNCLCV